MLAVFPGESSLTSLSDSSFTCKMRRTKWQTTPESLPGKSHRPRSLVGCSPWGRRESGTTELLTLSLSLYIKCSFCVVCEKTIAFPKFIEPVIEKTIVRD